MKTSKAVLGVLAGLAAGAAIGMLFAPDKGERTRRNLSRKGQDLMDDLEDLVDDRLTSAFKNVTGKMKSCNCHSAQENRDAGHATTGK